MATSNVVPLRPLADTGHAHAAEPPAAFVELPARIHGSAGAAVPAIARVEHGPELQVRCARAAAGRLRRGGGFLAPETFDPVDVQLYLPACLTRPRATLRCAVSAVSVPDPGTFLLTLRVLEAPVDDDEALARFRREALA